MNRRNPQAKQQGITLIVGLVLLILITLMVTTAFTLNSTNLKSVGNMQFRNEAISAANRAIETVIGTSFPGGFTSLPQQQTFNLDVNNDGLTDYRVVVYVPTCVEATTLTGTGGGYCGGFRTGGLAGCLSYNYTSVWQIDATVIDSVSEARLTLTQGFRQEISSAQKSAVCP